MNRVHYNVYTTVLCACMTLALSLAAGVAGADEDAALKGLWRCQEEGVQASLEFQSKETLVYNGEAAGYQLLPSVIRVMEEGGPVDYYYEFQQGTLTILSPDGSLSYCQKAKAPAKQARKPASKSSQSTRPKSGRALKPGPNWPRYERPSGTLSDDASDPQALLYKFAGRWDRVSSNTLTNLYLKPDGSYEEHYESGYSGEFHDQGGYQTGAWGAAGAEQSQGQWMIEGTLKQGKLTLIGQNGKSTVYDYKVHYKNGEYYWGEYFFNGQLYSAKYIYR